MTTKTIVKCIKAFDYLGSGESYQVEIGKKFWHFQNLHNGAGTFIPVWRCNQAMKSGELI